MKSDKYNKTTYIDSKNNTFDTIVAPQTDYIYTCGTTILQGTEVFASGSNITLEAPLNYIPLHVKGGSIIPQQAPNTTTTYRSEVI